MANLERSVLEERSIRQRQQEELIKLQAQRLENETSSHEAGTELNNAMKQIDTLKKEVRSEKAVS